MHIIVMMMNSGVEVPAEERDGVREELMREFSCLPVFLDDVTADLYYNGYIIIIMRMCNVSRDSLRFVDEHCRFSNRY
jgi:hypothetical protein